MPPFLSQHPLTCFLGGKNSIATPSSINFARLSFSMANWRQNGCFEGSVSGWRFFKWGSGILNWSNFHHEIVSPSIKGVSDSFTFFYPSWPDPSLDKWTTPPDAFEFSSTNVHCYLVSLWISGMSWQKQPPLPLCLEKTPGSRKPEMKSNISIPPKLV